MPEQGDQVLTAGTTDPSEPILDRPFPRARPSHDDFDGLVSGPQLVPQSIGDRRRVRPEPQTLEMFGKPADSDAAKLLLEFQEAFRATLPAKC